LKKVENYIKKEDELSKWYGLFLCILIVISTRFTCKWKLFYLYFEVVYL
jgi:hypothetical protein